MGEQQKQILRFAQNDTAPTFSKTLSRQGIKGMIMADPEFKLKQIGVIMLGVKDAQRSAAFYRDKLGLAVKSAFEGFVFLDGGGVTLCLSEALAKASPSLEGATEVVFSVADVRAAYDALRGQGVEFSHAPRPVSGPMWAANFRDPDGHGLSIFGSERA